MNRPLNVGWTIFVLANYTLLSVATFLCFMPLLQVLAISFSSSAAAQAGRVALWPVEFTVKTYSFVSEKPEFWRSIGVTLQRELMAVPLSLLLVVLIAFPLSKETREFRFRTVYVWIFVSDRTVRAAQIFLGTLPIMLVYPFLQRYFMKGIVLGSVKG
ncbi:ABC transporter permease family protein [Paenibacillus cymbidii]|uniref:hypothetical protein n=1 Tax=Paenibacillus cymbidii TaxID=1639034 RepID=UPI0010820364|nr:hypothetical protein [Paenibacillus cymbidii]